MVRLETDCSWDTLDRGRVGNNVLTIIVFNVNMNMKISCFNCRFAC